MDSKEERRGSEGEGERGRGRVDGAGESGKEVRVLSEGAPSLVKEDGQQPLSLSPNGAEETSRIEDLIKENISLKQQVSQFTILIHIKTVAFGVEMRTLSQISISQLKQ